MVCIQSAAKLLTGLAFVAALVLAKPIASYSQCPGGVCSRAPRGGSAGHMSFQDKESEDQQSQGEEMGAQQIMQLLTMMLPMLMQMMQQNQANQGINALPPPGLDTPYPTPSEPDALAMLAMFRATETAAAAQTASAINTASSTPPAATPPPSAVTPTAIPTGTQNGYGF
jgi:hypothetical protein